MDDLEEQIKAKLEQDEIEPTNPKHSLPNFRNLLIVILLLSGVYFSIKVATSVQENRTRALTTKPLNLILKLTKDSKTGIITVEKAIVNDGYSPANPIPIGFKGDVLEQVVNGIVVPTARVQFSEYIYGDDFSTQLPKTGDYRLKLSKPEAVVVIPYTTNAALQIRNTSSGIVKQLVSTKISLAVAKPAKVAKSPSTPTSGNDGYLDILFISSHYTDFNQFHADADAMANLLLTLQPFTNYTNSIRIAKLDNATEMGCRYNPKITRLIECDTTLVLSVASQVPFDRIIFF